MDAIWIILVVIIILGYIIAQQLKTIHATLEKVRFAVVALCEIQDEIRTIERVRQIELRDKDSN